MISAKDRPERLNKLAATSVDALEKEYAAAGKAIGQSKAGGSDMGYFWDVEAALKTAKANAATALKQEADASYSGKVKGTHNLMQRARHLAAGGDPELREVLTQIA